MMVEIAEQTLGDLTADAIAKYLRQIQRREAAVLEDRDPEDLHQMRVGLRRLRTVLQVLSPVLNLPPRWEKQVAQVGRQLGQLRDLDVVIERLRRHYWPQLPAAEQTQLAKVLKQLYRRRAQQYKQMRKLLHSKRYCRLRRLKTEMEPLLAAHPLAPIPAAAAVPDLVLPSFSRLWLHPGWQVGNADASPAAIDALIHAHGAALHSLRRQIKRCRYQLRLVSGLYEKPTAELAEDLAAMQDILGQLQDAQVMADLLAEYLPKAHRTVPRLLSLLAQQRQQAWQSWQPYQQRWINPYQRTRMRQSLAIADEAVTESPAPQPAQLESK